MKPETELEPIDPLEAKQLYLDSRRDEVAQATLYSHKSRLSHFVTWCEQEGIDNLNELSGRDLHRYKLWRRDDGNLTPASLKTQMDTIRVFIRFLEGINAVTPDLSTSVQSPTLSGSDNVRDVMLESERAEDILDYLSTYRYGSLEHVTLRLLWRTGMRVGAVRALDVDDYHPGEQALEVVHRPNLGTPLKNQDKGERWIALSDSTCHLLDDWLLNPRPDVTDERGREPLLATSHGRPHTTHLRGLVYQWTRPCAIGKACPHDRDPDTCEATESGSESKCPSSVSPHAIRRGSITHWLREDTPVRAVGDRMNVSEDVLAKHYDQRNEREKMEQRRGYLDNI